MAKAAKTQLQDKDVWTWVQSTTDKDRWSTIRIPGGDVCAPRIKRMSKNSDGSYTFYVYRNMKCIGCTRHVVSDTGLKLAQQMAFVGKPDPKVAADHKKLMEYVDAKTFTAEEYKALSPVNQRTIVDVYPWAMPSSRKLEAVGVKKPLTTRTDLMNKHEKNAVRSGRYNMDAVIKITKKGNPKREGTGQHMRWAIAIAHDGKTVREMFAAGGDKFGIQQMTEAGYMELVEK